MPAKRKKAVKKTKGLNPEVKPEVKPLVRPPAKVRIRVVGIGGGGGSIIAELAGIVKRADFVAANTDKQALNALPSKIKKVQFGEDLTSGLGAGMNPVAGEKAAREAREEIKRIFSGQDFCILVASLGGGTGSGAGPVFAEISRALGNVNLGIFTLPFEFEGQERKRIAENALARLKRLLNACVIVSNEKIFQIISQDTALEEAFSSINKILAEGLQGLIETILKPSLINIDFADLKTILHYKKQSSKAKKQQSSALAYLHSAEASGPERVREALRDALCHPLQDYNIQGAERILFNVSGSKELKMSEVEQISTTISEFNKKARIILGISNVPSLKDKLRISVLATKQEPVGERSPRPKRPSRVKRSSHSDSQPKGLAKESDNKTAEPRSSLPENSPRPERRRRKKKQPDIQADSPVEQAEPGKKSLADAAPVPEEQSSKEQTSVGQDPGEKIRRNALQLKKEAEEMEKEIARQEEIWETPAFLRRERKS